MTSARFYRVCDLCGMLYDPLAEGTEMLCGRCERVWSTRCDWFAPSGRYTAPKRSLPS